MEFDEFENSASLLCSPVYSTQGAWTQMTTVCASSINASSQRTILMLYLQYTACCTFQYTINTLLFVLSSFERRKSQPWRGQLIFNVVVGRRLQQRRNAHNITGTCCTKQEGGVYKCVRPVLIVFEHNVGGHVMDFTCRYTFLLVCPSEFSVLHPVLNIYGVRSTGMVQQWLLWSGSPVSGTTQ